MLATILRGEMKDVTVDSQLASMRISELRTKAHAKGVDVDGSRDMDESNTTRELTDLQVFEGASYDDFKFLTRALQKWSQSKQGRGASMGLNTGCLIAVPPDWTFEHRARFSRWVATAFGFRIVSVGGAPSFLRCSDAQGKGVLERLVRILNTDCCSQVSSRT